MKTTVVAPQSRRALYIWFGSGPYHLYLPPLFDVGGSGCHLLLRSLPQNYTVQVPENCIM